MDAVTYPNPEVAKELAEHWLHARVDVSEDKAVATLFGVAAIPTAVAATADGNVLGSHIGFLDPEPFKKKLQALRKKR